MKEKQSPKIIDDGVTLSRGNIKRKAALRNTVKLFDKLKKAWAIPPKMLVSDWADMYRRLSAESSAEAGRWRTSRAEYQREMMNAICDPKVKKVVFHTSSQIGKSEVMNNMLGYYMDYDPAPIMMIQPTEAVMESYSKDRIAPMIRDTPVLKEKIVEAKSRESGNTITYKKFIGGYLVMIGANAPSQLASRPIRVVLADEVDRFPISAGAEGDPLALAEVRQTTFWNKKTIIASTPTIKGASKIDAEYEASSQEVLNVACPHCGAYQPLVWSQIKFNHFKDQENGKNGNKFELLGYYCKECGCIESEVAWKKQPIKWVASNPEVKNIRGFHLNALASRWKTWESIVDDFLTAKKQGKEMLKVWVNTMLGESWEEEGEIDFNELLAKRRQYYNCLVPKDVLALTCGVDTQDNRLEYEIVGWGKGKTSWGIKYGVILGDPVHQETWDKLSEVLFATYTRQDGLKMNLLATCIDSGGHKTEQVYDYCRDHLLQNVFAIKGVGGSGIPFIKIPRNLNDAGVYLFNVGADVGKDTLYSRLKTQYEGEAGFCHFPIESDRGYDENYFVGLTSEHKVTRYTKGQAKISWEKRTSHARNEPLDIRNYATAALEIKAAGLPYDLLDYIAENEEETAYEEPKPVEKQEKTPERRVTHLGGNQPVIKKKTNGGVNLW
jgi:phage terminase large subunit GpA-like protein